MKTMYKYKFLFILVIGIFFTACDNFLDVNKNPNKQTDPTLSTLASDVMIKTAEMHINFSLIADRYTQQLSSVGGSQTDQYYENDASSVWYSLYTGVLADLDELTKLAEQEGAYHFLGMAQVLTAANLAAATDLWGDMPYSEALKGNENYLPKYDNQTHIYTEVFKLLDEGIVNLQKTDVNFDFSTIAGDFDLFFKGDVGMWIKLAYAYKARFLNHWSNTSQFYDVAAIKDAVNNSFTSEAEDVNFYYTEETHSPYYDIVLSNNTGNLSVTFGNYFISMLSGTVKGTGIDPRLAIIADTVTNGPYNGSYEGHVNGSSTNGTNELAFTENCFHFSNTSPIEIFTYAELQFILSEVDIKSGDKADAYAAWEKGVRANMAKLGVTSADIDAYIAVSGVDATNITIADVMNEKYIATFLNYEAWVDMRRYDYGTNDAAMYPGFTQPVDVDPSLNGAWARRLVYPLTERTRNAENTTAAMGDNYGMAKPLTWNK